MFQLEERYHKTSLLLKTFCFSSSIFYQSGKETVKIWKSTKFYGEISSPYQFKNDG
jgi:hypothetical protein